MNRWIEGARPRTLPAAIVPVLVGTAAAAGSLPGGLIWWRALAAMVVAIAIQVATNYVNDYADGVRGTDERRVGPVRLVAGGLATASEVKRAALGAGLVAVVAGLTLTLAVGPELRGRGTARVLFDAACEWARASGVTSVGLDTAVPAEHLAAMYARWGFVPAEVIRFEGKTYDASRGRPTTAS